MDDRLEILKQKASLLPESPGVYQYFNADNKIIYIGKAKNLKRRVLSYFNRDVQGKVAVMVSRIANLSFIVVDSESDALLLENNLVKKYQPKYNILLKDDKTFPWICIKNEAFPRVFSTRNVVKDGSEYYGPFTSGLMVKTLLHLIRQLFPLRTCNLDLDFEKISQNKYKVCLQYHIGNCKAPCIGEFSNEVYNINIKAIREIVKGNLSSVNIFLKDLMKQYAEVYDFENAQLIKEKIDVVEKYQSKTAIVNTEINNVDVYTLVENDELACVNFIKVVNGAIIQSHTVEVVKRLDETNTEILEYCIIDIRQRMNSTATEVLVPFEISIELKGVKFIVPQRGDKLKLLELSERNAKFILLEKMKTINIDKYKKKVDDLLYKVQYDLRLKELPIQIECFDNSNLQGTNPVAACVVFKNGKPSKADYRHFNVKTVEGPNDFASMEEIVYRRYKRLIDENAPLPQLIIIDGGKGQLSSATRILTQLNLYNKIAIIGIAKRLEEIFFPNDPVPIYLDKNSSTLKLIQNMRNEAHRFGITFHRLKRSNAFVNSELDNINGVGEKIKEKLFNEFKSIGVIKNVSLLQLEEVIGKAKAKLVFEYFRTI